MVVLNLGGEGEVAGAINLNTLRATLRSREAVWAVRPLVVGDFTQIPFRSGAVDVVVGNRMPLVGSTAYALAAEAFRVLRPGGWFRGYASSGKGAVLLHPLRVAGFADVALVGSIAEGRKP